MIQLKKWDIMRSTITHAARQHEGVVVIREEEKKKIASLHVITVDVIDKIIWWILFMAKSGRRVIKLLVIYLRGGEGEHIA